MGGTGLELLVNGAVAIVLALMAAVFIAIIIGIVIATIRTIADEHKGKKHNKEEDE